LDIFAAVICSVRDELLYSLEVRCFETENDLQLRPGVSVQQILMGFQEPSMQVLWLASFDQSEQVLGVKTILDFFPLLLKYENSPCENRRDTNTQLRFFGLGPIFLLSLDQTKFHFTEKNITR
jgi:hypothetical protein